MKKLSLLVGGVVLSTVAMAQKPAAADAPFSLEGQLGYQSASFDFTAPSIRGRYFVNDNIAVRLTLGINNDSEMYNAYEDEALNADRSGTYEFKNGQWNLGIGGEYHFTGTDRLSPYVGLDILLGGASATTEGTNAYFDNVANEAVWVDNYSERSEAKASGFGVNLVAGTDFYFAENFYLGFELGWGWMSWTQKEGTQEVTVGSTTTTDKSNEMKMSTLANNSMALFRLGWRF